MRKLQRSERLALSHGGLSFDTQDRRVVYLLSQLERADLSAGAIEAALIKSGLR